MGTKQDREGDGANAAGDTVLFLTRIITHSEIFFPFAVSRMLLISHSARYTYEKRDPG